MKKIAALMLAFGSTVVHAQTSVTFYGIADAAIVIEKGGAEGRITKVPSGAGAASRFGFRGTNIRTSNTITYASPKVNGFGAELAYSTGPARAA